MAQSQNSAFFSDSKSTFWAFAPLVFALWTGWSAMNGSLASRYIENERSVASTWQQDMTGAGFNHPLAPLVHETAVGFDAP